MKVFMVNLNGIGHVPKEECVKKWVVNDKELNLLRKGNALKCRVIDMTTGNERSYHCQFPSTATTEQLISRLSEREVVLEGNNQPEFLMPSHKWTLKEKVVSLLISKKNDLICQIFDKTTDKSVQYNAIECISPSYRCHDETIELIEEIKTKSLMDILAFLKDFNVSIVINNKLHKQAFDSEYLQKIATFQDLQKNADMNALKTVGGSIAFCGIFVLASPLTFPLAIGALTLGSANMLGNIYKVCQNCENVQGNTHSQLKRNAERIDALTSSKAPFIIEIEPISKSSQIDDRVLVSKFRWAVAIISYRGTNGNHTNIIVEGLNNGKFEGLKQVPEGDYFSCKCDLRGPDYIHFQIMTEKLQYDQRTEVWKVASEKAVTLLENIKEQMRKIDAGDEELEYSEFGPDENHPNAHNCCTWAKDHIKRADIADLGTKTFFYSGFFPARVRNYTKYGNSLYLPALEVPFSPTIYLNNIIDESDYSESSVSYRESL